MVIDIEDSADVIVTKRLKQEI